MTVLWLCFGDVVVSWTHFPGGADEKSGKHSASTARKNAGFGPCSPLNSSSRELMSRKCRYLKYNLLLSHRNYEDSLVVRHDTRPASTNRPTADTRRVLFSCHCLLINHECCPTPVWAWVAETEERESLGKKETEWANALWNKQMLFPGKSICLFQRAFAHSVSFGYP